MHLHTLTTYLNDVLRIKEIADYPGALNGLQAENFSGQVTKIAAAVDAHLPVVQQAVLKGCDFLLVHHGMFWNGPHPLVGSQFAKIQTCVQGNLAVYSAHLPLDGHTVFGNSMLLAKALEDSDRWEPFFPYKNFDIGVRAEIHLNRDELVSRLADVLGSPVHLCPGGPETTGHIGVVTGGAGSEIASMKEAGIDTFITGEGPHWSYTLAEELGINVLYGGHYATETFGVKALAAHLSEQFEVPWEFIDHPTGL